MTFKRGDFVRFGGKTLQESGWRGFVLDTIDDFVKVFPIKRDQKVKWLHSSHVFPENRTIRRRAT